MNICKYTEIRGCTARDEDGNRITEAIDSGDMDHLLDPGNWTVNVDGHVVVYANGSTNYMVEAELTPFESELLSYQRKFEVSVVGHIDYGNDADTSFNSFLAMGSIALAINNQIRTLVSKRLIGELKKPNF